ncbi:MAG: mannose-1-phosphate guanylyltransferase [Candidatus Kapabacteria bacterium]|nr:mannose-1-phosphate guanylyltransferase [Candidatus Kapabacteria bacterium]
MNTYVVIMAGGSGERFWPLSRQQRPKQLLKLTSATQTMLQEAIARVSPMVPLERVLIITSAVLQSAIIKAMPELPAANVIAEPAKRNTAPCLALAAAVIRSRGEEDAVMAVLTADHYIGDVEAFRADVQRAVDAAAVSDVLVTFGIAPTRPETGYGYIETADRPALAPGVLHVASFREKPDPMTALEYVRSGRYLWNSGMFFWRVSVLHASMQQHLDQVGGRIDAMTDALRAGDAAALAGTFSALPDISIDFGVMERASNVCVVRAAFPWDDVGSWDALDRMNSHDDSNNVVTGRVTSIETSNAIIVNATTSDHIITTLGIGNVVVVVTDDATMICSKDRAQDVKKIVAALRASGDTSVL